MSRRNDIMADLENLRRAVWENNISPADILYMGQAALDAVGLSVDDQAVTAIEDPTGQSVSYYTVELDKLDPTKHPWVRRIL